MRPEYDGLPNATQPRSLLPRIFSIVLFSKNRALISIARSSITFSFIMMRPTTVRFNFHDDFICKSCPCLSQHSDNDLFQCESACYEHLQKNSECMRSTEVDGWTIGGGPKCQGEHVLVSKSYFFTLCHYVSSASSCGRIVRSVSPSVGALIRKQVR